MSLNFIIILPLLLTGITALYKLMPHRTLGDRKPLIALLPKYKKNIKLNINKEQVKANLATLGFDETQSKNGITYFNRGSLLGDFSVKLIKINLGVKEPHNGLSEITLEAAWVAAFDTGDFWILTTELVNKLESF